MWQPEHLDGADTDGQDGSVRSTWLPANLLAPILIFVLLAAVLLFVRWPIIQAATYECGDLAANSLLVQDAKSFQLLVGNYSRVGFNHPGPALLYILAAGEVVFHDWLRITPAPLGGQMAGTAIYSAAWVAAMWPAMRRLVGSAAGAVFSLGIFVVATAFLLPGAFVWVWPPDLYYFPFAAFTLALGEMACGRFKAWLLLAVSWGFLLNGHICFWAVTTIMVVLVLAANWRCSRGGHRRPPRVLSRLFLQRNWPRFWAFF